MTSSSPGKAHVLLRQSLPRPASVRGGGGCPGNGLADLERLVISGFDDQNPFNSMMAKRERRGATGDASANDDDCSHGAGGRHPCGASYSPVLSEFIGQGWISTSSSWLSTSRNCVGLYAASAAMALP